ncbi:MAG: type VI secretion system baseplate subunit TssG [Aquabacterium sp.]|nr:type VI secretion system baseplate subunit TssG [Aquabacterium sp.]
MLPDTAAPDRPRTTATPSPADRAQALQALLAAVQAEPWAHDYFALLRRIDALRPEAPRTGHARRPVQEALRLGQVPEFDFAPAALAGLQTRDDGPPRLGVRFFGLLGPQGPMPLHFTEYVRERLHQHGDATLTHFLDLFHHRLLSLFYRAWAQSQPAVHLDRPADDRYTPWLSAAAGLPNVGSGALPAAALAFQAGHLAGRTHHPEALCKVLKQYFGVAVSLRAHVGEWLAIQPDDRSRLGHARNRTERSLQPAAALGRSANTGHKVWDRQYKFRLHLGPLSLAQYLAFVPGGSAWRPLQDWVRVLAGPDLRWDLQLQLDARERPAPRLGRHARLGLTAWLGRDAPGTRRREDPERQLLRLRPATTFLLRRPGAPHG